MIDPVARSGVEDQAPLERRLEDRVGRIAAERLLVPRWSFSSMLRNWRSSGAIARFELVHLPVALRTATTSTAGAGGWFSAAGARKAAGAALGTDRPESHPLIRCYVVERVLGHGWAVALPSSAVQAEGAAATAGAGALLPARLELDACTALLEALAMRGALVVDRGRRSALTELGPARAASYPFWLSYRRDRRGRLRFDALDAVTGSRPGSALRATLAAALVDADAASRQLRVSAY